MDVVVLCNLIKLLLLKDKEKLSLLLIAAGK
jgi:hypothetical protein